MFKWWGIVDADMPQESKIPYDHFDWAYHQLMLELVVLQIEEPTIRMGQ